MFPLIKMHKVENVSVYNSESAVVKHKLGIFPNLRETVGDPERV